MSRLYARANRNQQQDYSGRLAGASMTPQERATAFIKSTFPLHLREDGEPCDGDIEDVVAHDKETRRAALLEAAKLVGDYNCMHDHGKKATKACDDVFDELTRLAQEGA